MASSRQATALRVAAVVALLAGCSAGSDGRGGVRSSLGLDAPPPDPFLTVSRAPLRMPPDLRELPAPRLGAPSLVEPNAEADVIAALSPAPAAPVEAAPAPAAPISRPPATQDVASRAPSPGETALLGAAGATQADPAIRQELRDDARPTERRYGLDSIFGVRIVQDPEAEAQRLDPREESGRLQQQGVTTPVPPPAPED